LQRDKEFLLVKHSNDIYRVPSIVLSIVGAYDLLRGFMHTFLLKWSATNFAKFDMATVPQDQVFLLGVFGISNFLTGAVFLLISRRARHLSPHILIFIPAVYLLGWAGIWSNGIHGQAAFNGKYFMFIYFAVCLLTYAYFLINSARLNQTKL
jgi:hypothetical protein